MWNSKYRPKKLEEFVNQVESLDYFLKWVEKWKSGSKALLFHGPPGTGKTSLIQAFAREKNIDFIEMNASDFRSANQIREVLGRSVIQQSIFKKGKIFLIDEIDGLAGRQDWGGTGEIIKILKESVFPIILTANNPWDSKLRSLRSYCHLVQFGKISIFDIEKRLVKICAQENIQTEKEVLRELARVSQGDLRSAINDLETISRGKKVLTSSDLDFLGKRERESTIFDALKIIFKTKSPIAAKLAINNTDKDPNEIFWWIKNNIANEYEDPREIAKAYEILSKADIFKQRISQRQDWKFLAYMIDLMTAGVSSVKKDVYRKFTRYQYPSNLIVLGGTKIQRKDEKELLLQLSEQLHCSTRKIRQEYIPFFQFFKAARI